MGLVFADFGIGRGGQIETALDAAEYFRVESRAPASRRTLRNMLTRPGFSAKEVRTFRGIITALTKERR